MNVKDTPKRVFVGKKAPIAPIRSRSTPATAATSPALDLPGETAIGLKELSPGVRNATADTISVHGLRGSRMGTWSRGDTCWPPGLPQGRPVRSTGLHVRWGCHDCQLLIIRRPRAPVGGMRRRCCNVRSSSIPANHMHMTKFRAREDQGCKRVLYRLRRHLHESGGATEARALPPARRNDGEEAEVLADLAQNELRR